MFTLLYKMWRPLAFPMKRLSHSGVPGATVEKLEQLATNIMESDATRGPKLRGTSMQNMDMCSEFCDGYKRMNLHNKDDVIAAIALRLKDLTPIDSGRGDSSELEQQFYLLARSIGHLPFGVKFLSDMRADILDAMKRCPNTMFDVLQSMEKYLQDLLSIWFSLGLLKLERVTWDSPCSFLEKVIEYETVHPLRGWSDLKNRVGAYRRCFVLSHPSMPGEPLIVLHVALTDHISQSINTIISTDHLQSTSPAEKLDSVKCAIFYSINSTQKGLRGIELGNHLIKNAVIQLKSELIHLEHFSTLSPIPGFRQWILHALKSDSPSSDKIMQIVRDHNLEYTKNDLLSLLSSDWNKSVEITQKIQPIIERICAHYLYNEKHRGYAYNTVAHFHLRNGATMWRLNWAADTSRKGLANSFGMMVNYKYVLEKTESNSRMYTQEKLIDIHPQITSLVGFCSKL